jgi:hypothetical protein
MQSRCMPGMKDGFKATLQVFWLIGAALTYIVSVAARWQDAASDVTTLAMNLTVDIVLALTWPLVAAAWILRSV